MMTTITTTEVKGIPTPRNARRIRGRCWEERKRLRYPRVWMYSPFVHPSVRPRTPLPRTKSVIPKGRELFLGRITNLELSRTGDATLHSPSTPRDVFFVVRGMAYATDRTAPLSLVLTLDALARRACRNGAPILLRLAEPKFILVFHARSLSLSLSSSPFSLASPFPHARMLRLRVSPSLFLERSTKKHVPRVRNVEFFFVRSVSTS